MKRIAHLAVVATLFIAPIPVAAQHGHGGFRGGVPGGGYRGGFGGGYAGRGMGMGGRPSVAALPRAAGPVGHPYAGRYNPHFSNRPLYHGGWYRGDWNGHWAGPWGYRPWGWGWYGGWGWGPGWGLGVGWGLGGTTVSVGVGSPWNWGYFGYYNPYWAAPVGGVTYVNYTQPVVVSTPPPAASYLPAPAPTPTAPAPNAPAPAPPPAPSQSQGLLLFSNAQTMFRAGQYEAALNEADRAVVFLPNDSLIHEFRGLCLFALGDYQPAAAAVHAVVSAGPGWNWATVSNLYGNPTAYTGQLRAIESYCNDHPTESAPRFLLAYHYLLAEHNDEAAAVLHDVVRLQPDDQLAAQLLKGLTTPRDTTPTPAAPTPTAQSRPVERATLLGHWRASRPDGSSFVLDLSDDNRFNWKFRGRDREQQFAGTFTLANNLLILQASDQNALVGQVSMETSDKLNFRLAGGNPAEPGLTFTR